VARAGSGRLGSAGAFSLNLLLVVAACVVVALALARLRVVVVPVIAALFLAALLTPLEAALRRIGAPRSLASLVVVVGFLLALGGLVALIVPRVAAELPGLGAAVTAGVRRIGDFLTSEPIGLSPSRVDRILGDIVAHFTPRAGSVGETLVSGAVRATEALAGIALAVVLLFFFIRDGARLWEWAVGLFSPRRREEADELGHRGWRTLVAYLRGIAVVASFDTAFIGLALWLLEVPLVLPLMLLVFFGAFFPIVGAAAAGIVAVLVAFVTQGAFTALVLLGAILLVQQIEGNLLYPVIVGRQVHLHPVAILLAFAAGAALAGVLGALVAIPLAAVVGVALDYYKPPSCP
jgi:predicted PurR-regulated permease PerM